MKIRNVWKHLNAEQKDVLVIMALLPPPVSLDHLVAASSCSVIKIVTLIEELLESGALSQSEALGKGYYYFTESRSATYVLESYPGAQIRSVAKTLMRLVEKEYGDGPKKDLALTHLVHTAGIVLPGVEPIISAAQYCWNLGLREDAATYFQLALERLPKRLRTQEQQKGLIEAVLGIVAARGHLMPLSEQRILLEKASGCAKRLRKMASQARIALILARVLKSEGDYGRATKYFDQGWALARQMGREDILKWAALSTTEFLFWQGKVAEAVERYEQVIGNLEELPSDETTLRACASLGWCYAICGESARGVGLIDAVRERAGRLGLRDVKIYSDLTTVLNLLESRRVGEVEPYLTDILSLPEEVAGHYVLWAANACKAYVLYHRGAMKESFRFLKQAHEHSKQHGWPHHRGPWNFELLDALEKEGMVYPEMCYESEITRVVNWPDMYMQGVGLRFRAQRAIERNGHRKEIEADLQRSLDLLSRSGARLEFARTQLLLARLRLHDGRSAEARHLIEEAWKTLSRVNEEAFPADLREHVSEEDREKLLIKTVVEVGTALGTVRNQSEVLQRIINLTMRLTRAERGGFFLLDEKAAPKLVASRNLDPAMVSAGQSEIDWTTIKEVAASGHEVIATGAGIRSVEGPAEKERGWMICTPAVLQDRVVGVLYLECNLIALEFPGEDLPLLRAIGNQVAIALDNVRAYEEIARLRDRLEEETRVYKMELESSAQLGEIVGESKAMRLLSAQIEKVAPTDSSVLITGETGVGKGLVARVIHRLSYRADGPFIPVSASTLTEGLVAGELFGHEKGAFTGASTKRIGRFELADGGTLFLDDVDNLNQDIQMRLLRTLQEKEFERVGGNETIRSDFRVISATNQDLHALTRSGHFRSDLYYRLNVFPIHIAPLRQRKEDVPALVLHFLNLYSAKIGKNPPRVSESQMRRLTDYEWPGNVRELQHIVERALILSDGGSLQLSGLGEFAAEPDARWDFLSLEEMERSYIVEVLRACNWRVSGRKGAARLLQVKPTTLYSKIRRLGIKRNVSYGTS